jgi:thiol-disulfide isomerase/thioredoxin
MTIAALLFALIAAPAAERTGEPVLLDFHASWCGPCQQMRPAVGQLIQKGYRVKSIDIDRSPELAERYEVTEVPTFIVVDEEGRPISRTKGAQPASQLARLYLAAKAQANPPAPRDDEDDRTRDRENADVRDEADESAEPAAVNPKPWETVVRIRVHNKGSIGFGSGTIIYSSPRESIVLTCAHIFHLEGQRQVHPSKFPLPITIDLFDGNLVGQTVHTAQESLKGEAIDYDFDRDVGLIRITPGRRLPASRVVPAHWKPQPTMKMTAVGCSEGHDATAWTTIIKNPHLRNLFPDKPTYEAIECTFAPKQGRSGGGLYTTDGFVAGVCDFAEPRGNHGLYASPRSIHALLDRNKLTALYAPVDRQGGGTLLAGTGNSRTPARTKAPAIARLQSPDRDDSKAVTIPPPEMLGIKPVASPSESGRPKVAIRRDPWRPAQTETTESTDLKVAPEADNDRFSPMPSTTEEAPVEAPRARKSNGRWQAVRSSAEPSAN